MTDGNRFEMPVRRPNIIDRIDYEREHGIQNPEIFLQDIWTLYRLIKRKEK